MKRGEILDAVKKTITQDRNNRHGEPENSFSRIAEEWTRYLERQFPNHGDYVALKPYHVAEMLAIFKTCRFEMQPDNPDNEHDRIGYYAIAAELRAAERAETIVEMEPSNGYSRPVNPDPVLDTITSLKGWERAEIDPYGKPIRPALFKFLIGNPFDMDGLTDDVPVGTVIACQNPKSGIITHYERCSVEHILSGWRMRSASTYRQRADP